ncbi:hypothetical protein [Sphingomonas corticis]|uniref:Uncharacterized protein n=1 Tax=Sphingomonas corticis TaxID=2722791 RepID=A0ABX1CXN1_9SPHN|nr:hypothetical protein [Sphingomonas corticis]NJR80762.1 hypothetical protein [Sphingomonas corticis]
MSGEDHPKHLQVEQGWLGRVLALLTEIEEDSAPAAQLLKEAPYSIQDRLVAIRHIDLNNPAHIAELNRERDQQG